MQRRGISVVFGALAACSSGGAGRLPDLAMSPLDPMADLSGGPSDGGLRDGAVATDGSVDLRGPADLATPPDLSWNGIFTVRVRVDNVCKITSTPAAIAVPAGTSFKVTWVNDSASSYNIDIDKIDRFNQVPLILGLTPGMSWTDTVRDWCGIFTGTFSFRIRPGCDTYYIPVDCNK